MELVKHLALALKRCALVHEHLARLSARVKLCLHLLLLGFRVCATEESLGGTRDGSVVHTVAHPLRACLGAIGTAVADRHEFLLCGLRLMEELDALDRSSKHLSSLA